MGFAKFVSGGHSSRRLSENRKPTGLLFLDRLLEKEKASYNHVKILSMEPSNNAVKIVLDMDIVDIFLLQISVIAGIIQVQVPAERPLFNIRALLELVSFS